MLDGIFERPVEPAIGYGRRHFAGLGTINLYVAELALDFFYSQADFRTKIVVRLLSDYYKFRKYMPIPGNQRHHGI